MQNETMIWLALAHVMIALVATIINVGVSQGRASLAVSRDSRRLREALRSEMLELLQLYHENSAHLGRPNGYFSSNKACTSVYRANLSRLISLPDNEIQVVVAAYAGAERLDQFVAANCKPHGATVYKCIPDETPADEILARLEAVCAQLQQAVKAVGRKVPVNLQAEREERPYPDAVSAL